MGGQSDDERDEQPTAARREGAETGRGEAPIADEAAGGHCNVRRGGAKAWAGVPQRARRATNDNQRQRRSAGVATRRGDGTSVSGAAGGRSRVRKGVQRHGRRGRRRRRRGARQHAMPTSGNAGDADNGATANHPGRATAAGSRAGTRAAHERKHSRGRRPPYRDQGQPS